MVMERRRPWRLVGSLLLLWEQSMGFLGPHVERNCRPAAPRTPKITETLLWNMQGTDDYEYEDQSPSSKPRPGRLRPTRPSASARRLEEHRLEAQKRHAEALKDPTLLTNVNFADRADLHPSTKRALTEVMGLQSMTDVQLRTYAAALQGNSVVARARTGTGKTLAYLLPIVERLLLGDNDLYRPEQIGAIILAPSRELAVQIAEEAKMLLHFHDLTVLCVYGGTKIQRDTILMTKQLPSILVATPGRLLDHMEDTRIRGRRFRDVVSETKIVTLDEADRLLDTGFRKDIKKILSYLPRATKRQTLLFSATIPRRLRPAMRDVAGNEFVQIDCVGGTGGGHHTNTRVEQTYILLDGMQRYVSTLVVTLSRIMSESVEYKVVVFFPTAKLARFFFDIFEIGLGSHVVELHSRMSQSSRQRASSEFRKKSRLILFTSDVSARGVDYPDVTHVIQYGYPDSDDTYVHRLGRTARAGRSGYGVVVLLPFESSHVSALRKRKAMQERLFESGVGLEKDFLSVSRRIRSGDAMLTQSAEGAYKSFLAYYLSRAHVLCLSKEVVVEYARDFAQSCGLSRVPALSEKMATMLDVGNINGVVIERGTTK